MGIRSLVLCSIAAAALSLASPALADVPNPTSGSGGSGTTTGAGGSPFDPGCTVAREQTQAAGRTCQTCDRSTTACSNLGNDYHQVCLSSATVAVYCNGPLGQTPQDQNVACSVSRPGAWSSFAAGGALAVAAALMMRRRKAR